MLLYIVVSLAPLIWYAFATNHSQIHAWFTNKACAVSVMAICFALIQVTNKSDDLTFKPVGKTQE